MIFDSNEPIDRWPSSVAAGMPPIEQRGPMAPSPEASTRYPRLDAVDVAALTALAEPCSFKHGETIFRAGECDLDLFVVESGGIDIITPSENDRHIVTHSAG